MVSHWVEDYILYGSLDVYLVHVILNCHMYILSLQYKVCHVIDGQTYKCTRIHDGASVKYLLLSVLLACNSLLFKFATPWT